MSNSFCRCVEELSSGESVAILDYLRETTSNLLLKIPPPQDTRRKKKKRKREGSTDTPASLNSTASLTSEEASESLLAPLCRGADICSLVVLHTPVTLWSSEGIHREKAVAVLLALVEDVCVPLMAAATPLVCL